MARAGEVVLERVEMVAHARLLQSQLCLKGALEVRMSGEDGWSTEDGGGNQMRTKIRAQHQRRKGGRGYFGPSGLDGSRRQETTRDGKKRQEERRQRNQSYNEGKGRANGRGLGVKREERDDKVHTSRRLAWSVVGGRSPVGSQSGASHTGTARLGGLC